MDRFYLFTFSSIYAEAHPVFLFIVLIFWCSLIDDVNSDLCLGCPIGNYAGSQLFVSLLLFFVDCSLIEDVTPIFFRDAQQTIVLALLCFLYVVGFEGPTN